MYVCKFVRRVLLSLLIAAALVSFSPAQETTPAAQPSQADCLAAASSGGTLPAGCAQDESQQRNIDASAAGIHAATDPAAAVDAGRAGASGARDRCSSESVAAHAS